MSYPILYEANATDFFNNGLGTLPDAISSLVTEERNGEFVLDMTYPLHGTRANQIKNNRIIKVDAGHKLTDQRFVIKTVTPAMNTSGQTIITVHAEHVSYLANDLAIKPHLNVDNTTAEQALRLWNGNLTTPNQFTVDSDITTRNNTAWSIDKFQTGRQVLGGVEGSILDVWGGDYRFDNLHVSLLKNRGTIANTLLAYGRNITSFEQENNIIDTYTSVYPFFIQRGDKDKQDTIYTIDNYVVDSSNVNKFPNKSVLPIDVSGELGDIKVGSRPKDSTADDKTEYISVSTLKKRMKSYAQQYINNNNIGVPKVSIKVSFVDLARTSNYADVAPLEQLDLCDEVPVRFSELNIDTTAKVSRIIWNVLTDSYDSIELGEISATLGDKISQVEHSINKTNDRVDQVNNIVQTGADGKSTVFRGQTTPTANHIGDLWYKPNGGDTEMYQWDGVSWHFVMSTKDTHDISDKVDQAMQEMADKEKEINGKLESNQIDISQAQQDINQARQDAAVQLADIRKSVAKDIAEAKGQSKDAYDKAVEVDTKADTALENSKDAKETSQSIKADVDTVKGELSSKADKSTVNTIGQTVNNQQTEIKQNANDIKSKAESSVVNKLKGTVEANETKLLQTAQGLAGKADSSQLNKLSGDLTTLSNNFSTTSAGFNASLSKIDDKVNANKEETDSALSVAKADIKATADNLSTNYTKTTDEHNYVNSQIKQSADKINLSVASVSDKVDGMEIGGRNYLNNTNDITLTNVKNYTDWILDSGGSGIGSVIDATGVPVSHGFRIMNNNEGNRDWQQYVKWEKDHYIFSIYAKLAGDSKSVMLLIRTWDDTGSGQLFREVKVLSSNDWTRFTFAIDATKYDISHKISLQFGLQGVGSVDFAAPQLERGTKVTDYGPAPEDTDSKIAALQIVDDQIKSTVSNKADTSYVDQKANQITSTVGKQFDNLQIGGRNYLLGSGTFVGLKGDGTHQATVDRAYTLSDKGYIRGKTMTFSVNVSKTEGTTGGQVGVNIGTTWQRVLTINIADIPVGAGKRFSRTIVVQDKENRGDVYFQTPDSLLNGTLTFSQAMFAIGDKAIDYAPAPEDDRQGINDNKNAISKVDQKADSISSTVTNNQNANNAKFSSLEQNLNGFKSTVYSKSDVDNKVNTINGNVNKKADSSDVNNQLSKKADVSQITQLSDRINLKVSQTDFDNMQIGGRNYLLGTANSKTMTGDGTHQVTADRAYLFSDKDYVRGKQMMLSVDVTKTEGTTGGTIRVIIGRTWQWFGTITVSNVPVGTTKRLIIPVTVRDEENRGDLYFQTPDKLLDGSVTLSHVMMVEGTKPTDWTPAPEDKADKDNLVSQINIDKSGVLIQGKKIMIDGNATIKNAVIKSSMIDTLSANKITTGTLNAANVNIINMNVSKLVGDTTNFVQSAWNGISGNIYIDSSSINVIGDWGANTLDSWGIRSYAYNANHNLELVGNFSSTYAVGNKNINGTLVSADYEGDFVGIGYRNKVGYNFTPMVGYFKQDQTALGWYQGTNIIGHLILHDYIKPLGGTGDYIQVGTINFNNIKYAYIGNSSGKAGFAYGSGYMYLISQGSAYRMAGWKIPIDIASDGKVKTWIELPGSAS